MLSTLSALLIGRVRGALEIGWCEVDTAQSVRPLSGFKKIKQLSRTLQLMRATKATAREKHRKVLQNTQIVFFSDSIYSPSGPKLPPFRGFNGLANTDFPFVIEHCSGKKFYSKQLLCLGLQWVV